MAPEPDADVCDHAAVQVIIARIAAAAQSLFITLIPSIYCRSSARDSPQRRNLGGGGGPPQSLETS